MSEEVIVYVSPLITKRSDGGYEITYPVVQNDEKNIKYRPQIVKLSAIELMDMADKALEDYTNGETGINNN